MNLICRMNGLTSFTGSNVQHSMRDLIYNPATTFGFSSTFISRIGFKNYFRGVMVIGRMYLFPQTNHYRNLNPLPAKSHGLYNLSRFAVFCNKDTK